MISIWPENQGQSTEPRGQLRALWHEALWKHTHLVNIKPEGEESAKKKQKHVGKLEDSSSLKAKEGETLGKPDEQGQKVERGQEK